MSAQPYAATSQPTRGSRGGGIALVILDAARRLRSRAGFDAIRMESAVRPRTDVTAQIDSAIDLYWLPLGAGGRFVRWNGRAYEALAALWERRRPQDLYHSALEVTRPEGRFVIEMTPIPDANGAERGVVAEGAVGSRLAARFRLFRYELRRWKGGAIPDVDAIRPPAGGRAPGWKAGLVAAKRPLLQRRPSSHSAAQELRFRGCACP